MTLTRILELIQEHGEFAYSFVFSYIAGSNSLMMPLFAGYAAHLEAFSWGKLILACWAGSFFGDTVRFWIGRRWGRACFRFSPNLERRADTIARLIDRHYLWMIMIHRYPHGIRVLAGLAFGMSRVSWPAFLGLNFVSAGVWALIVVSAGYSFGHLSEETVGSAASGASFAVLLVFLGLAWFLSRKLDEAIERR
jgi:membrane protein DedA with SNARE-associated domain